MSAILCTLLYVAEVKPAVGSNIAFIQKFHYIAVFGGIICPLEIKGIYLINFYKSCFYEKDIFPLSKMEFEGIEFPVPANVDSYLTNIYGNWRKLPSEEKIRKSMHYPLYVKEIFGE